MAFAYTSYKVPSLRNPILETPHISYLEDRYLLGSKLGLGQFGVIRSCKDLLTGETLACKSISKDRLISSEDINTVKLEIEVMARLSGHPNIVDLKAVYEEEEFVHLVMELCAGGELFHRLEKNGRFSEHEAAILFKHLIEVVMYCHEKGIVHRDLKPENILLVSDSSYSQIKLADFGLATYFQPGRNLQGTVGSPFYISPEVLAGGYNEKADIWSCGVILYILLSGIPPFWGKTKSRIFESIRSTELRFPFDPWDLVSYSAKDLISRMLTRDPNLRLSPKQVLEHEWIRELVNKSPVSSQNQYINLTGGETGSISFSSPVISASRDVSFGNGSNFVTQTRPDNNNSPIFACRSSFSAFLIDDDNNNNNNNNAPCSNAGFSFGSNTGDSSDFAVISMPSFSFTPFGDTKQEDHTDKWRGEVKRASNREMNSRNRRKRNHTIGLGEVEQLELVVTESVIRWASCTFLSATPSSLRSSLVF